MFDLHCPWLIVTYTTGMSQIQVCLLCFLNIPCCAYHIPPLVWVLSWFNPIHILHAVSKSPLACPLYNLQFVLKLTRLWLSVMPVGLWEIPATRTAHTWNFPSSSSVNNHSASWFVLTLFISVPYAGSRILNWKSSVLFNCGCVWSA